MQTVEGGLDSINDILHRACELAIQSATCTLSEQKLEKAMGQVDGYRSHYGALNNRFESAIGTLSQEQVDLGAAKSRIEDADYAVEASNMTRARILQQASTSMLAQANQNPQSVLSLLD